jgi:hypothetical protein
MSPSYTPEQAETATCQVIELAASFHTADLAMTALLSAYATIATNGSPQMLASCTDAMERALHVFKAITADVASAQADLKH